jgi:CheY-like chemotaxis protein
MVDERPRAAPHVLVVDDDPGVRAFIGEVLDGEGYRTRGLESGETALQLARRDPPALLVLDLFLPDLDGYTIATQLRVDPATAHIPVIFITGSDVPVHRTLSFGLGAVAHLPKPFTAAQLLRAVGLALGGR